MSAPTAPAVPRADSLDDDGPAPRVRPLQPANLVQTLLAGYVPLVVAVLVVFLPLLWMVLSSFKQPGEIVTLDLQVLPESLDPENYRIAITTVPFGQFFLNSTVVTVVGSGIKVLLAILTAYALVFVRFPFKKLIFMLILVALMVPPQVSILPNYILIAGMGGKNTLWGIILPGLGTAFGTFLLRQHFLTLPASILEAAEIDGAGHWRRLWQIVGPGIPALHRHRGPGDRGQRMERIHLAADHHRQARKHDAARGLTLLQNSEGNGAGWGILMAGAVLVILPILVVFAMLQRYIVAGLTQGSVTG